jgi:C1A family cysteine protease
MKKLLLLFTLAAALTACPTDPPKSETLFTPANTWTPEIPANAEQISPEDFQKRVASGELVLSSAATINAQKEAREQQYAKDKTFLQNIINQSAAITALLTEVASSSTDYGDRTVQGPGGEAIMLLGLGAQLRQAADAYERFQSVENALESYKLIYGLLSDNLKAQAPTPDSLNGKSLSEIQAALAQVNDLLGAKPTSLETARLEPESSSGGTVHPQALNAGNGTDTNGACTPANLAQRYWFPLKNFVSPMKNQGFRNTCWAFAAIGAVESRERVQNNNPVNLSEQFLINKVKQDWSPSDYVEGGSADYALTTALNKNQILPSEPFWTYNPALGRSRGKDGEEASYFFTCIQGLPRAGGGFDPYNGTCSDTAHQSKRVCTLVNGAKYCSSTKVEFAGAGIASSKTTQIWNNGSPFFLNSYRQLLSQGNVLIASFPTYKGFMDDVKGSGEADITKRGVVSNYSMTKLENGKEVPGAYGGHVVQIVGFLSNDDLTSIGITPNIGGGGYFIIKNSWGCNAGDAGYYYVPADYVSSIFSDISVLNFDNRRSDAWNRELVTPGGANAPTIDAKALNVRVDLRVETDLAKFFKVSHPVAKSVNLSVTSDKDGSLYNGAWNTDPNALFGSSLKFTFATPGARTLTLVAKYGSTQARNIINVDAVNTPPTLTLQYADDPRQNENYVVAALVTDINEQGSALCASTIWSVDAPDTLATASGCLQSIKFGATGLRQVRVSTKDSEGASATQTLTLNVLPPPVNPYPRVSSVSLNSRELKNSGGFDFCVTRGVSENTTIDLRQKGCLIDPAPGQPLPNRYFIGVAIENPDNEALTYDWALYATGNAESLLYSATASRTPSFELPDYGISALVSNKCRITLKVNAPDATRSKGPTTVWQGTCTYNATRAN